MCRAVLHCLWRQVRVGAEGQDRRPGAGQHRCYPAAAQDLEIFRGRRHRRGALRLMKAVLGGRHEQVGTFGERHHQKRSPAEVETGIGVADFGQEAPPASPQSTNVPLEWRETDGCRGAGAPARRRTAASGRRSRSTTPPCRQARPRRHCRDAPRTPRPAAPGRRRTSEQEADCAMRPFAAASPPTTAAADEPSPRECGIALWERTINPLVHTPAICSPRSMARTTR